MNIEARNHTQAVTIIDLLPALGNHEAKALTLIAMGDGNLYTDADLRTKLGWGGRRGVLTGYCRNSLAPIGLVVKEAIDSDGRVWGYKITDAGITDGIPLAGGLLQWSLDHPRFSLHQMLGATPSRIPRDEDQESNGGRKRAAETRFRIFWELSTNPSNKIRVADIVASLEEYSTLISQHIENLDRLGVIACESTKPGQPFAHYKLGENPPNTLPHPYRTSLMLTGDVYRILQQNPGKYLSIEQVIKILVGMESRYKEYRDLTPEVSGALASLQRQGYADVEKFHRGVQSEIRFTDEQKEAMASLVSVVDAFQRQDPIIYLQGESSARSFLVDQDRINILINKARENSPRARAMDSKETFSLISSITDRYPNSTAEEVQRILAEEYDKPLTRNSLRKLLSQFVEQKGLQREKTKKGFVYR